MSSHPPPNHILQLPTNQTKENGHGTPTPLTPQHSQTQRKGLLKNLLPNLATLALEERTWYIPSHQHF